MAIDMGGVASGGTKKLSGNWKEEGMGGGDNSFLNYIGF